MIKVDSKVIINRSVLQQITRDAQAALEQTAEALHSEVKNAQVIPMDKGTLKGEAFFCDYSNSKNGEVSLVHNTPYARRLYFHPEYNFNTEFHVNARGEWFEDWLEGGEKADFAPKTFAAFMRQKGGS